MSAIESTISQPAIAGDNKKIEDLDRASADIRHNDNNGETLSMKRMVDLKNAIWQSDNNTTHRLVEEGAHIDIKDDAGSTLLHWAAQENKVAVMEYLLLQRTIDIHHSRCSASELVQATSVCLGTVCCSKSEGPAYRT